MIDDRVFPIKVSTALETRVANGQHTPVIRLLPWALFSSAAETRCKAAHGANLTFIAKLGGLDARELVKLMFGATFCGFTPAQAERAAHAVLFDALRNHNGVSAHFERFARLSNHAD